MSDEYPNITFGGKPDCRHGGPRHRFDLIVRDRPWEMACKDCGKVFVRDRDIPQGYRPRNDRLAEDD